MAQVLQLRGVAANEIMCNAQISACAARGRLPQVLDLLEEMPRQKIRRSKVSFNSAAEACQKSLDWENAVRILEMMRKDTVQPDVVTVSLISSPFEAAGKMVLLPPLIFLVPALGFPEAGKTFEAVAVREQQSEQMTALEILADHDALSSFVERQFNQEWRHLERCSLAKLTSPLCTVSASEKAARRLFDQRLNRYFSLGVHFTHRALSVFFPVRSSGWSDLARVQARRNTSWSQEASAQTLSAWLQFSVATGATASKVTAGATYGYGGYGHADASVLLPVMVQHDRSRRELKCHVLSNRVEDLWEELEPKLMYLSLGRTLPHFVQAQQRPRFTTCHLRPREDRLRALSGLCVAALHDTVEDNDDIRFEDLESIFGLDVRRIVEGETKASKRTALGARGEWSRRYTTLFFETQDFQKLNQLLSMRHAQHQSTLQAATHDFSNILRSSATAEEPPSHGRRHLYCVHLKGLYSLWDKMRRKPKYHNNIDNIDDVIALRIVLDVDQMDFESDSDFAARGAKLCNHALALARKLPNWLACAFLRSTRNRLSAYFRKQSKDTTLREKDRAVDLAAALATAATAAAALPLLR
eukprot:Skav232801  [mRNA]  locus=scaffold614:346472:358261:- [translate_table: standard]